MSFVTKQVEAGKFRTLEWTINQPIACVFRSPAGARVHIGKLLFSTGEQKLDGKSNKVIRTSMGKIKIKVSQTTDVTYAYFADGKPGKIIEIDLP